MLGSGMAEAVKFKFRSLPEVEREKEPPLRGLVKPEVLRENLSALKPKIPPLAVARV